MLKKIILNTVIAILAITTVIPLVWVVAASFVQPTQAAFMIQHIFMPEKMKADVSGNTLTLKYHIQDLDGEDTYTFGSSDAGEYVMLEYSKRTLTGEFKDNIRMTTSSAETDLESYDGDWLVYFQVGENGKIKRSTFKQNRGILLTFWNVFTFSNYKDILADAKFRAWLANSLIVSLITSFLSVILGFFAGYSFSRFKFPGRNAGLMWVMATQLFPLAMMLVPFFILAARILPEAIPGLEIVNSLWGIILVYSATTLPFSIWMLKGHFDTIPVDLEEAASIDGASLFQLLFRVLFPVTRPAIFTAFLFSFIQSWNEYAVASMFLNDPDKQTLPLGLQVLMGGGTNQNISWFAAGAVIVSIPIVILFLSMKKELVEGATMGAVKG